MNPFWYIKTRTAILLTISLPLVLVRCQISTYQQRAKQPFPQEVRSIAVVGFSAAPSGEETTGLFHCPLCGATFMGEPVPKDVAGELTVDLYHFLRDSQGYVLIPPSQARRVFSGLSSRSVGEPVINAIQATANKLSADAVLFGYVYRWRERAGTAYAVSSPASVAFDLHLVSGEDATILWKDSFTKTQLSLSENLLDISTFIRSGSKWLTARELARIGIEDMITQLRPPF